MRQGDVDGDPRDRPLRGDRQRLAVLLADRAGVAPGGPAHQFQLLGHRLGWLAAPVEGLAPAEGPAPEITRLSYQSGPTVGAAAASPVGNSR